MLLLIYVISVYSLYGGYCVASSNPRSLKRAIISNSGNVLNKVSILTSLLLLSTTNKVNAVIDKNSFNDNILENALYSKPIFNVPPGLFEYPSYFEGAWNTDLKFVDGKFTPTIPFKKLSSDINIAGFRKFSVLYIPDIGSDANNVLLQYKKDDKNKHIIEDRASNINSLFQGFTKNFNVDIDLLDYMASDEKNPNRLSLRFHDNNSKGRLESFTNSRYMDKRTTNNNNNNEYIRTIEHIRQYTARQKTGQVASQIAVDYALEWLYYPIRSTSSSNSSGSNEQTTDSNNNNDNDITSSGNSMLGDITQMRGTLRLFSYLQPQDEMYFHRPVKPVAVFTYNFNMNKIV